MKNTFKPALFVLLMCGVFAADRDKVKTVMEGDSVTLNPDLTQIQGFLEIQWRFNNQPIAYTDGSESTYPEDERFRDRLKLNQTGSLTITNMRTKHSGLYHLLIELNSGPLNVDFSVTVSESPAVGDAGKGEMKMKSVNEGDSVTLQTDVTELHGDELIVWRSGEEGKLIAKADIETKSSLLYDTDERFRCRLKLENKTGSLIISDTTISDSGLYKVKISSSTHTTYKRFNVTVTAPVIVRSGLSSGAVAGIVLAVLLVAAAAAVAAVIYHRRKISELRKFQPVPVFKGDTVTLKPDTEIQTGDQIQWTFEDKEIFRAEIKEESRELIIYDGPDGRFINRLELNEDTGSLTIWDIRTEQTGNYKLKITRGRETLYNRFNVSINVDKRNIAVMEGEPVTLKPATEINKDNVIQWMFGDENQQTLIAEFSRKTGDIVTYVHVADGRFSERLYLDKRTGSLTIMNTRTAHSGLYKLQITSSKGISQQTFIVIVNEQVEEKLLKEDCVTLNPDREIQRDDRILWMFGPQDSVIAQIRDGKGETYDDVLYFRFKDRLTLDETGALTITNIGAEHMGLYKLLTISSRKTSCKKFKVFIQIRHEVRTAGESVCLNSNKLIGDDEIQWMFGNENSPIAEIKGGTRKTYDGPNGRFRDRLKLDKKTGDLIINNSTAEDAGCYKLKICSSEGITHRRYAVIIRDAALTNEARTKPLMKDNNDSTGERVNESEDVVIPFLDKYVPDGVNEEEGTSSL